MLLLIRVGCHCWEGKLTVPHGISLLGEAIYVQLWVKPCVPRPGLDKPRWHCTSHPSFICLALFSNFPLSRFTLCCGLRKGKQWHIMKSFKIVIILQCSDSLNPLAQTRLLRGCSKNKQAPKSQSEVKKYFSTWSLGNLPKQMSFSFIISAGEPRSDFVSRPQPMDYLFRFLLSPETRILCLELELSCLKEVELCWAV